MEVRIIDGKAISAEIRSELVVKTEKVKKELGVVPGLSVIMVGDDPASAVYVRNKEKACAELGFRSELYKLSADVSEVLRYLRNSSSHLNSTTYTSSN